MLAREDWRPLPPGQQAVRVRLGRSSIEQISYVYGRQAVVISVDPTRVYVQDPSAVKVSSAPRACCLNLTAADLAEHCSTTPSKRPFLAPTANSIVGTSAPLREAANDGTW